MPKYWGKQIFAHGRFPEVGQKQKTEEKKEERERERLNNGENNGQATHGARKHAWRTQAAWAKRKNICRCCVINKGGLLRSNLTLEHKKQSPYSYSGVTPEYE